MNVRTPKAGKNLAKRKPNLQKSPGGGSWKKGLSGGGSKKNQREFGGGKNKSEMWGSGKGGWVVKSNE